MHGVGHGKESLIACVACGVVVAFRVLECLSHASLVGPLVCWFVQELQDIKGVVEALEKAVVDERGYEAHSYKVCTRQQSPFISSHIGQDRDPVLTHLCHLDFCVGFRFSLCYLRELIMCCGADCRCTS